MNKFAATYQRLLGRPVDIASLAFFRVAFGILALVDVVNTWGYYHLQKGLFDPDKFQFRYYGFEWVQPVPEPWMSIFFITLMLSAVGIILGRAYRFCTVYFALGFIYTFLLEKSTYLNHGYLFCWLSVVMIFLPADRQWSWMVWKNPERRLDLIPFWNLLILRFLIGVVYFFGGVAKINGDWLRGIPLIDWMAYKSNLPVIGPILGLSVTPYLMAYVGLVLDLTVVFFLINRRTRPFAFAFVICFHLLNMLIFNIGIFPYLSVAITALYFPPDFPRKILRRLAEWLPPIQRVAKAWRKRMSGYLPVTGPVHVFPIRTYVPLLLTLFMIFHILLPLRHHLFPGNVAWTEEGHRYSWRMMLRSKRGKGFFRIVDENNATETIRPGEYLSSRQERKLYTHPDMILQFAHYLRDKYAAEGKKVAVFAEIEARLNNRSYQTYIDPSVDLAAVEWSFFRPSEWILPLVD